MIKTISSTVMAAFLLVSQITVAVEFGPNSANITNPYWPIKVGDWGFSQGFGPHWSNRIFYTHAIGTETVSGAKIGSQTFNNVKTLKINVALTDEAGFYDHEFFTFSFAQDTDGNVWVMKVYSHRADQTGLLGGQFIQSMFMPAVPAVGLPAGIKMPEDNKNYCRIVQVGIQSLTTSFGTYSNCFEANCYDEDPTDIEVEYYCLGIGVVRSTNKASLADVTDLKEYGEYSNPPTYDAYGLTP